MMFSGSPGKRSPPKFKMGGAEDEEFLNRIEKSMYYSRLPRTDRLSLPVTEFAAELFSEVRSGCTLERLDVEEAARISRNACVSPCAFVLSLLYLERLKGCNPEYLYKVAPAELFLVSLMVANKFLNDDGGDDEILNSEWAVCGNLSLNQVNKLEKEFLDAIEWRIFVDNDDFWNRLKKLERTVAEKEGRKRGWFSYWEMTCLMETIRFSSMIQTMVSVSSVFLAAYTAGVITLLGSALVASNVPGTSLSPRNTTKNATTMTRNSGEIIPADGTEQLINFPRNFSDSTFEGRSEMKGDWWSFTSWLAELEASKAHLDKNRLTDGKIEASSDFVASFVTDSHVLMQNSNIWNDLVTEINWRDTLTQSYLEEKHTWSYYMKMVSRASTKRLIY